MNMFSYGSVQSRFMVQSHGSVVDPGLNVLDYPNGDLVELDDFSVVKSLSFHLYCDDPDSSKLSWCIPSVHYNHHYVEGQPDPLISFDNETRPWSVSGWINKFTRNDPND